MLTTSRADRPVVRLCRNAVMLALALALSFLEHLLPLSLILPLPGVKLGLANLVTVILLYMVSPLDAAAVSLLRIGLSALLFGTPVSFFFSILGGIFAYLIMLVCKPFYGRAFSFIGVSILSATGHHFGQILAAAILFDTGVFLTYLPVLLPAGIVMGSLTGLALNLCENRLQKILKTR